MKNLKACLVMALVLGAITLLPAAPASAQPVGYVVTLAPDSPERIAQLARDTNRTESLRAVRNLEIAYSQYGQAGLWDEMGSLFTDTAEIVVDGKPIARGGAAMAKHLKAQFNGGKEGLPKGAMHALLMFQPVVTLSFDGRTAAARWSEYEFSADGRGSASLGTGKKLNQYVRENGVWNISRTEFFTEGAGSYEDGIHAFGKDLPQIPYGFTPAAAGRPVPDEPSGADHALAKGQSLEETERHIDRLNDEDQINNLQNKYGYYIDRKMWSDVTDLFVKDGVLEIAGRGIWSGTASIRRALEVDGPEGLQIAQVNDHMQFPAIVAVDASGLEARARGLEFGVLTPKAGEAYWSMAVFENRYVKQNGVWHIAEMRLYPVMKSDYYVGWGKSSIVDPAGAGAPDKPSALPSPQTGGAIVAFFTPNPVTGKPVAYPLGAVVAESARLLPASNAAAPAEPKATIVARLEDARRKLNISRGYDAASNVSSAFGYYLDDDDWDDMASVFAVDGTRPQGPGFYVGPDHIYRAMTQAHYRGTTASNELRPYVTLHTRMQPVIDVSNDGLFAKIRTRMFLTRLGTKVATGFNSGIYPNDTAVVENGVWKMQVGGEIDETYYSSFTWKDGWARRKPLPAPAGPRRPWQYGDPEPITDITNTIDFPPDIPRAWFENFRLKDMESTNYPDIKPMWFAYRNPVSGRVPPNYCPDFLKCAGY